MSPNQPGQMPKLPIPGVKNLIAVGSGKGGVGKTTVAVNLAVGLAALGHKTGLMDADVYGPNVPLMMGINQTPMAFGDRIQPLEQYGVKLMSMGFLSPGDKPLVWRGPMLHSVIQQFLRGVDWGELDYLVIDLPPGTGDVQRRVRPRRRAARGARDAGPLPRRTPARSRGAHRRRHGRAHRAAQGQGRALPRT